MLGAVSGAHLNPVVTLVDRAFGGIRTREVAPYIAAQVAGGCLGAMVANLMFELPAVDPSTKVRSSGALWLSEAVATAGFLLVIHGCVRSGRANVVAVAVGVWIGGAYFFTSSTSFANPAVTIARTLSDTFAGIAPSSAPMFIVMQLAGAVAAYVVIRILFPNHPPATPASDRSSPPCPDISELTVDQRLSLTHRRSRHLAREFDGVFGEETIGLFLATSYDQFADRAKFTHFLPLMAERFARQRLKALAKVEGKATDGLPVVLFLCVHNAGRSQMALGWFQRLAGDRAVAWSGGSEPALEVNPPPPSRP